jgi:hypothetical protein
MSNPEPPPTGPSSTGPFVPVRATPRRRAGAGGGARLFWIVFSALIVIAAVVVPLVLSVGSTIQVPNITVPSNSPTVPSPHQPTTVKRQPSPSYLTAAGLRAGLAHIARVAPGARLSEVRVAGDSLIASAQLPNGNTKEIIFEPTGNFTISEPSTGERPFPISQIRPRAVVRIVSAMRTRYHIPVGRIDYIVLSSPPGAPTQWVAFAKAPGHPGFTATLSGAQLTRLPG